MPLALQLVTRPVRVAGLVAVAGVLALLGGAVALGAHPLAPASAPVVLVATGLVLGALAPLYGRGATIGLWAARAGIALGAVVLAVPVGGQTVALRVAASLLVLAGLRLVARGSSRVGDLPVWSVVAVGVGIAATILAPGLGGAAVLGVAWLAVAAVIQATLAAPTAPALSRAG
jgi:hypothetical protein